MSLIKKTEQEAQKVNRLEVTPVSRVEESADAFTLTVELPGVGEKDVELTLENRTLSVTAENTVPAAPASNDPRPKFAEARSTDEKPTEDAEDMAEIRRQLAELQKRISKL